MEFTLDQGVSKCEMNKDKETLLQFVADYDLLEVVQFLINKEADIESRNNSDEAPLDTPRKKLYEDIVIYIETQLRNRLNFFTVSFNSEDVQEVKKSCEYFKLQCDALAAIQKSKKEQGVNVNDWNKDTKTLLHFAADYDLLEVVQLLMSKEAGIEARNNSDETLLDTARKQLYKKILIYIETRLRNRLNIFFTVCPSSEDIQEVQKYCGYFKFQYDALAAIKKCIKDNFFDVFIVRGKDRGKHAWHYVLIDPSKKEMFLEQQKTGSLDCKDFGKILYSGWGENPPQNIKTKVLEFFNKVSNNLYIIKEKYGNLNIYHYIWIDLDKKEILLKKSETILSLIRKIENCGRILYSGWGKDPPESISDRIESAYFCTNETELKGEFSNTSVKNSQALYDAARNGKLETLRGIIKKGVDVNSVDKNGWTPLHHAAYTGQLEVVKYLISSLAHIHVKDTICGRMPLHIAGKEGHTGVIKLFLNKDVEINATDEKCWTTLHYAVWGGHLSTVRFLIDKGVDINAKDSTHGKKPIHIAAKRGCMNIVKFFLRSGVNLDDTDRDGRTSLYYAVWGGYLEVVKYLADESANIHAENTYGTKPIHLAAMEGHRNIIEFLLERGVNVNDCNEDNKTPLHFAAEYGQLEVVQFLINKEADIETRSNADETPLEAAIINGHKGIIKYIESQQKNKQKGVCTECPSSKETQESKLHFEFQYDALTAIKTCFEKCSFIFKTTGKDRGKHAWHYTLIDPSKKEMFLDQCKTGSVDVAEYGNVFYSGWGENPPQNICDQVSELEKKFIDDLLVIKEKSGNMNIYHYILIDPDKKEIFLAKSKTELSEIREIRNWGRVLYSGWGQDPPESISYRIESAYYCTNEINNVSDKDNQGLHDAARNGELDTLRSFVKKGVDVNSVDKNGWTPLHHAAYAGQLEVVKYLISSLVNIHVKDTVCSRKPVHIAAREGYIDIVKLFLTKGVNVDDADKNSWTPLHYAAWGGHLRTVRFLIDKGADINTKESLFGKKSIHIAAERGYRKIVKLFRRSGVNAEDTDRDGRTSLYYAVWRGHLEVVEDLAEHATIHAENTYGTKPIHLAAMQGHQNAIEFLLDRGVNVNDCTKNKDTPLHYASEYGQLEVVQFLVNKKADIKARNNSDETPLDIARRKLHKKIVTYLETAKE